MVTLAVTGAILLYSGLPRAPHPDLRPLLGAGGLFRENLAGQALNPGVGTDTLMSAAEMMRSVPCVSPMFIAESNAEVSSGEANQWAMSFSGTWTEASSTVNRFLFTNRLPEGADRAEQAALVVDVLEADDQRCVLVPPTIAADIALDDRDRFGERIVVLEEP